MHVYNLKHIIKLDTKIRWGGRTLTNSVVIFTRKKLPTLHNAQKNTQTCLTLCAPHSSHCDSPYAPI